jgi:hypothetical protein
MGQRLKVWSRLAKRVAAEATLRRAVEVGCISLNHPNQASRQARQVLGRCKVKRT